MTRTAFCADVHLANHRAHGGPVIAGINDRCRLILKALADAVALANQHDCDRFVVLGDLFDTTKPLPQVIAAAQQALLAFDGEVVLLMGNHDRNSAEPGDHALGPLVQSTSVLAGSTARGGIHYMPFDPRPVLEWLPEQAAIAQAGGNKVMAAHFGLYDAAYAATRPWVGKSADAAGADEVAAVLAQHGIKRLFVGNWHTAERFDFPELAAAPALVQVGALVPTGWDNPGLKGYGGVVVHDSETGDCQRFEVSGPRFVTVRSMEEHKRLPDTDDLLFVRWVMPKEQFSDAADCGVQARKNRIYEFVVDEKAARALAQTASASARSQNTLFDSLVEYVARMPLEEGADRDRVFQLAKGFLKL